MSTPSLPQVDVALALEGAADDASYLVSRLTEILRQVAAQYRRDAEDATRREAEREALIEALDWALHGIRKSGAAAGEHYARAVMALARARHRAGGVS